MQSLRQGFAIEGLALDKSNFMLEFQLLLTTSQLSYYRMFRIVC